MSQKVAQILRAIKQGDSAGAQRLVEHVLSETALKRLRALQVSIAEGLDYSQSFQVTGPNIDSKWSLAELEAVLGKGLANRVTKLSVGQALSAQGMTITRKA